MGYAPRRLRVHGGMEGSAIGERHALDSVPLLSLAVIPLLVTPASAAPRPSSIPLPDDFQPEGIAVGEGNTFYVGSLRDGDIYRGDLRSGAGALFVDVDRQGERRYAGRQGT